MREIASEDTAPRGLKMCRISLWKNLHLLILTKVIDKCFFVTVTYLREWGTGLQNLSDAISRFCQQRQHHSQSQGEINIQLFPANEILSF